MHKGKVSCCVNDSEGQAQEKGKQAMLAFTFLSAHILVPSIPMPIWMV